MSAALGQAQGKIVGALPGLTALDNNQVEPPAPAVSPSPETATDSNKISEPVMVEAPPAVLPQAISVPKDPPVRQDMISTVPLEQDVTAAPVLKSIESPTPEAQKISRRDFRRFIIPAAGILLLLMVVIAGYIYYVSTRPPNLQLVSITYSSVPLNASTAKSLVSLGWWDTDSFISDLAFSPDGALLATANNRDWVRLSNYRFYSSVWQVDAARLQTYLLGHEQWVAGVAFSPDGKIIATASEDASINLWQAQDGSLQRKIETTFGAISSVDFSPNNLLLAAGSLDGYVGLWQVSNGNLLRTMQKQEYSVEDVKFSPDGSLLAEASDDGSIRIWSVSDGTLLQTLQGHSAAVKQVAFSPDSTLLASASEDKTIGIWRLSDGVLLRSLQGHSETVRDVAFTLDGSLLASGSEDYTLRLWQVSDGQLLSTFSEEGGILSVAFSPNSYYLVSGADNGYIHFWGISEAIPFEITSTPASP
jgi:WD40 repeat protein